MILHTFYLYQAFEACIQGMPVLHDTSHDHTACRLGKNMYFEDESEVSGEGEYLYSSFTRKKKE